MKDKKNHYCDKHEEKSNVEYRKLFSKTYFQHEKNTYQWVHLEESEAIDLEKDEDMNLLENTFIKFEENDKKMREYHVDTHPIFMTNKYEKKLSIRRHPTLTRPLMMIGQDETVFKQYSLSQKCWVGPDGETQLLLKSDGYSRMISGFVSRSFKVGVHLSETELNKVNERRVRSEWCHYLSKDSALTVYGTTRKKKLVNNLTLMRFFDVGINLEGFWNYDQMALQVEDMYDVVSVKFPQYNFLLLLDQSSGHGRMREESLNANLMSSRFGGKQGTLRNSEIKEIGPYQSILNVGDIQHTSP